MTETETPAEARYRLVALCHQATQACAQAQFNAALALDAEGDVYLETARMLEADLRKAGRIIGECLNRAAVLTGRHVPDGTCGHE